MSRRLNIAVLGCGQIALDFHLPAINECEKAHLYGLCDSEPPQLKKVASQYPASKLYSNFQDLLNDSNVNVILISTPHALHAEQAIKAMQAGKHVMVEKPFALTYQEARRMHEASVTTGYKLMCLQHNRFKAQSLALKEFVKSGEFGDIYYCRASGIFNQSLPLPAHYLKPTQEGGGPVYDIGAHLIDLAWWLMDCPKPISVVASSWNQLISQHPDFTGACEDFGIVQIRFSNNSVLNLEVSYMSNAPEDNVSCTFYGTKGYCRWPDSTVTAAIDDKVLTKSLSIDKGHRATTAQINHFFDYLEGAVESCIVPVEQSVEVSLLLEAATVSSKTNELVLLEHLYA